VPGSAAAGTAQRREGSGGRSGTTLTGGPHRSVVEGGGRVRRAGDRHTGRKNDGPAGRNTGQRR
jgi:hypothetical protein